MEPAFLYFASFIVGVAMAIVAPKVRQHLSADALFGSVRAAFSNLSDHRLGDPDISLSDALMSAFARFSLKSPSLLAVDKERAEDNLQQVDGIERAPCDTFLEGHDLLALDGTRYFASKPIHGETCLENRHRNGTMIDSHQM